MRVNGICFYYSLEIPTIPTTHQTRKRTRKNCKVNYWNVTCHCLHVKKNQFSLSCYYLKTFHSQSGFGTGGGPALASWAVRLSDSIRAGGGFDPYWFEPVSDTALWGEHDWRQAGRLAAEGRPLCPLHGTFTTAERERRSPDREAESQWGGWESNRQKERERRKKEILLIISMVTTVSWGACDRLTCQTFYLTPQSRRHSRRRGTLDKKARADG